MIDQIDFLVRVVEVWRDPDVAGTPVHDDVPGSQPVDGTRRIEQQDTTGDGRFDVTIHYERDLKVRIEEDTTADGRADAISTFAGGVIVGREADTTGDGRFDSMASFEDGVVSIRAAIAPGIRVFVMRYVIDDPYVAVPTPGGK